MNTIRSGKFVWLLVVIVVFLGVSYIAFRAFTSTIHFTYYAPSYLPPGIAIKEKRVSITDDGTNRFESVDLNFRTEDWVYSIMEYKASRSDSIGTADQKYNEKSVKPTCSIYKTPNWTKYRLCHWVDYGKIGVQEVKFKKGSTFINAMIPTDPKKPASVDEITKFVNSFKRKSINGIPIERSRYFG